jgi:acyl-homoserine lactone acylase PvdQ
VDRIDRADALPRAFNPPSGVIFSANNEIDRVFNG